MKGYGIWTYCGRSCLSKWSVCWLAMVAWILLASLCEARRTTDIHGGIPMGVSNNYCDNAKWRVDTDWNYLNTYEYTCRPGERKILVSQKKSHVSCLDDADIPLPLHVCMTKSIHYKDKPPRGGPHRPLWPKYGEYIYVPPQRWVHSLEHGAAVFLYDPCMDPEEIATLKQIAKSCLRRHIITPYRKLTEEYPLAIVTWGCKLTMSYVDTLAIQRFLQKHALDAPESSVWKDGQYKLGLLDKAKVVSDIHDSIICPDIAR